MAEEISVTCAKSHLYQWQMTANENWNGANQQVKFKGNYYLCSNSASPRCAPGFCVDSECRSCIGGFPAAARSGVLNLLEDEVAIFNPGVPKSSIFNGCGYCCIIIY
eukprot:TRINITY_DN10625_c0_g1_i1.p1 TRINITY_DN10625_c0_g1~~TRINITY_DN10625_c0_g1_i1.p1  ORF type:complete len:107 (+),score=10.79 TRINITY_DN10625_c0_g1_i1:166-486(+)